MSASPTAAEIAAATLAAIVASTGKLPSRHWRLFSPLDDVPLVGKTKPGPLARANEWRAVLELAYPRELFLVISHEHVLPNKKPTRTFTVTTLDDFLDAYTYEDTRDTFLSPYAEHRHEYEIVYGATHVFIDLEFDRHANPSMNGVAVACRLVRGVLTELRACYGIEPASCTVVTLDASVLGKYSHHITIVADGYAFADNTQLKPFMARVAQQLIDEDVAAGDGDIELPDAAWHYVTGRGERKSVVDRIYDVNRAFRLYGSSKWADPERALVTCPLPAYLLPPGVRQVGRREYFDFAFEPRRDVLAASLASNVPHGTTLLYDVGSPLARSLILPRTLAVPSSSSSSPAAHSLPSPSPPAAHSLPSPALTSSSSSIIAPASETTSESSVRSSSSFMRELWGPIPEALLPLYELVPELVNASRSESRYCESTMVLSYLTSSRYCFAASKEHSTSRTGYRIYVKSATMKPSCLLEKCKRVHTPSLPLPAAALALLRAFLSAPEQLPASNALDLIFG